MTNRLPVLVEKYRPRSVSVPVYLPERGKMYYRYSAAARWNKVADAIFLAFASVAIVALLWSAANVGTNGAVYDMAYDQVGMLITVLQNQ